MKLVFSILIIFFAFLSFSHAQDTIFMQDGEEIEAKVTEVLELKIKYKKYSNLNGPTYYLDKSEVFIIKYENGEKDIFKEERPVIEEAETLKKLMVTRQGLIFAKNYFADNEEISRKEYKDILQNNNKEALRAFRTGRATLISGQAIVFPSAAILGLDFTSRYFSGVPLGDTNQVTIGAATMTGVGLALIIISEITTKRSAEIYNLGLEKDTGFHFNVNENGVGLSYRF